MTTMTAEEQREVLEEVIGKMDEIADLLRSLGNDRIRAYVLADFEGRSHGWLGEFARDIIEQELAALDAEVDGDDEG